MGAGLSLWPSYTDDSGTGRDGTEVNASLIDDIKDAILDEVHDTSNPTVQVKSLIQEIINARGSKASVDARLDVSMNEDGTLKSVAGQATTAELSADIGAVNLWQDSGLILWPDGDSSAPWNTTLSGAGAGVARCGTGLADTTTLKDATWVAKVSYGSANAKLTRSVVSATQIAILQGLVGKKMCFAARGKCSVQNMLRLVVDDGVGTTYGGLTGNGTWHSGGGSEELLYVEHTINSGATKLDVYVEVAQTGDAYFGAPVVVVSSYAPTTYRPDPWKRFEIDVVLLDELSVGDGQNNVHWRLVGPAFYMGLAGSVNTAPVGAAITFDVEFDSVPAFSSAVSPYSTAPDIDDGDQEIDDGAVTAPDGTYANRCRVAGDYVRFNIDQVGSGTAGSDLTALLVFLCPVNPLAALGLSVA